MWWCMPVFSPHRRLRQDDLNSGFSYIVTLSQKKKKKRKKKKKFTWKFKLSTARITMMLCSEVFYCIFS
jgi:hypothetical protein